MKISKWFVIATGIFITTLITANIIAVKIISLWGLLLPAGVIIFPISYIFGDVLTEVYGYGRARLVIWLGFSCNLLAVAAIAAAQALPSAPFWQGQEAYKTILGYSPRLLAASFLAYLVGEFSNSYVLARLKVLTAGRWLWIRTISSTIVGEGLDSLVFITLAFWGSIPGSALVTTIVSQWLIKSAYEALVTPLTYVVVGFLKRQEGVDVYDRNTSFNPFTLQ
jgi:queuosine precursor transporter